MYRDDPLDDEMELRQILGEDPVDRISAAAVEGARGPVEAAVDVLRVLQGWADDEAIRGWFLRPQRRLDGRPPVEVLADGAFEEVEDAARLWIASRS